MTFNEFLIFRSVKIRNKDHERVVRMFYPHLTSVCGIPEALSIIIGAILGIDLSNTAIATGCFSGMDNGIGAPYGIPELYCKWANGTQVYVYGSLPKSDLIILNENDYVIFALSVDITENIDRMADRHIYMH